MQGKIEKKVRRLNQLNKRLKAKDSIKLESKKYKIKQEFLIFKKKTLKGYFKNVIQLFYTNYFVRNLFIFIILATRYQ